MSNQSNKNDENIIENDDEDDDDKQMLLPATNHSEPNESEVITLPIAKTENDEESVKLVNFEPVNSINTDTEQLIPNVDVNNRLKGKLIYFSDLLISALIFGPITGFYWYGSWSILDNYFMPNNLVLGSVFCYLLGLLLILPGYVFQTNLQKFHDKLNPRLQIVLRILFIYFVSFAVVMEWRGCWVLLDKYLVMDWKGQLSLSIIAISYMLIARSFYYVLSPPFVLHMDSGFDGYFLTRSRYRFTSVDNHYIQHSFDFFISELIESFAAIISWRGIAYTIDLFLFPNNLLYSILSTVVIGHLIYFILMTSQFYIYSKTINLQLIPRLVIEDTIKLLMFISVILVWEFYWLIIDNYMFIPDYKLELYLAFHFLPVIISLLLDASIVITGPACEFKDGELNDDNSYFYISYFATLIENNIIETNRQRINRRYVEESQ